MNNLCEIRKLSGNTQEDVARLLGVSRVMISKMENDEEYSYSSKQKEELSIYFGIGPEYFSEKDLDDAAKKCIIALGKRMTQKAESESYSQSDIVNKILEISPIQAMKSYMISTKVLLVKADELTVDQFKDIIEVNKKLGVRLEKMLEEKQKTNGKTINEEINLLLEKYE